MHSRQVQCLCGKVEAVAEGPPLEKMRFLCHCRFERCDPSSCMLYIFALCHPSGVLFQGLPMPMPLLLQCKHCSLQNAESAYLTCSLCQQYHSGPCAHILGWPWGKVCMRCTHLHRICMVAGASHTC